MSEHELPPPRLLVDGEPLAGIQTTAGHLGGYDLTIATTIGPLAIDVRTVVLGHFLTDTAVAHCIRAPGIAECKTSLIAPGGLTDPTARARRVLEHYLEIQQAVETVTRSHVTLDIDDAALTCRI